MQKYYREVLSTESHPGNGHWCRPQAPLRAHSVVCVCVPPNAIVEFCGTAAQSRCRTVPVPPRSPFSGSPNPILTSANHQSALQECYINGNTVCNLWGQVFSLSTRPLISNHVAVLSNYFLGTSEEEVMWLSDE